MPAKPEFKAALQRSGYWKEACDFRDQLKAQGVSPKEANQQMVNAFADRVEAFEDGRPEPEAPPMDIAMSPCGGSSADKGSPVADSGSPFLKNLTPAQYTEFVGRDVDIVIAIRWVAKHLGMPMSLVKFEDIPSAEALGMLEAYRSPIRRGEFWDKMYSRLVPSKTQLDNRHSADQLDGSSIIAVCAKILAIKNKIEGESADG